jgi:hypothetical protein
LVLQLGGASGDGYISEARFQEGVQALKSTGTFAKGVYSRVDASGKKINQDAYEAVWESIHQTELHYRKSEYPAPVFMDPQTFEAQIDPWAQQSMGVLRKSLGVFSQRKLAIGILLVDSGSAFKLQPHSFGFVLKGDGEFQGRAFKQHATFQSDDSSASLQAHSSVEMIEIHLPPRAPTP